MEKEKVALPRVVVEFIEGPLTTGNPKYVSNDDENRIYVLLRYGYGEGLNVDALYSNEEFRVDYHKNKELCDYIQSNKLKVVRAIMDGYEVLEPKVYAKIKGWELVQKGDELIYWNYAGEELYVDDRWENIEFFDVKTSMTKKEWNELGITEENAVFEGA